MKRNKLQLVSLGIAAIYGLAACGGDHDHDEHAHGHDHSSGDGSHDDDPDDHHDDEHDHDHDHDHETIIAGPNGGRVLTSIEPHAEFFVTAERHVQIGFVDDDLKQIPAADQSVDVVAGDRSKPTKLTFRKSGEVLISEEPLPDGNDFPVIVQIKNSAASKSIREKFNLNLEPCPTCEYKEYACTCEHGDEGDE